MTKRQEDIKNSTKTSEEVLIVMVPATSGTLKGKVEAVQISRPNYTSDTTVNHDWDDEGKHRTYTTPRETIDYGPTVVTVYGDCTIRTLEQIKQELEQ